MSSKIVIPAIWGVTAILSTCKIRSAHCRDLQLLELDLNDVSQVTVFLDLFLTLMFLELPAFYLYISQAIVGEGGVRICKLVLR